MANLTAYASMNIAEANKRAGYDEFGAVLGDIVQRNEFLQFCPMYPSTHGLENKVFQAKRLGTGTWSKANGPLQSISSEGDILVEPIKMYEGDSQVDDRILKGADDPVKLRDSEDAMNLEGFLQGFIYDLFYVDNVAYPDAPKSLSSRRGTLASDYTFGGSGTGSDLTSLWTFEFGPNGFYLVYNKGGTPGIVSQDMGRERVTVPTGSGQMRAWVRHYEIWAAPVLRNNRAMIRYANIETSGTSNIFSASDYLKNVQAQLPSMGKNAIAFGNRTIVGQITADAYNKSNAAYSLRDIEGFGPVAYIGNIPVRMIEALLNTETAITA